MPRFGSRSLLIANELHPRLRSVMQLAIARTTQDFTLTCGTRSKEDQEKAFKAGNTKVHYPNSAHNQTPSCAVDVIPYPFKGWDDKDIHKELKVIADAVMSASRELGIPIRWGGDFNRDGNKTTSDAWDKPHFELHPWRDYAKK